MHHESIESSTKTAMEQGQAYYRTRQHIVPAGVPTGSQMEERGWGLVCSNLRAMRQATSQQHWEVFGLVRRETSFFRVELLTFQMALGIAGQEPAESPRFSDLVATGLARADERDEILRAWCDNGEIPAGFKLAGKAASHAQ